jgi:aryl-alcohol dehydrogenase-like predicted oxidoreductase
MTFKLGLGCWGLGNDAYGQISEKESSELIRKAILEGVNFFDTSPTYGNGLSEERLGKYLPRDGSVLVATKVGMSSHSGTRIPYSLNFDFVEKSVNDSLRRLKLDALPLVQLHSPMTDYKTRYPDISETMSKLVEKGKVIHWGISLANPKHLPMMINDWTWKSIQFNYSLIDQRVTEFSTLLSDYPGIKIARTPFNFGFLTQNHNLSVESGSKNFHISNWSSKQIQKWQFASNEMRNLAAKFQRSLTELALRFVCDSKLIDVVIPGAMTVAQLLENVSAFKTLELNSDEISAIMDKYQTIEKQLNVETPYARFNIE